MRSHSIQVINAPSILGLRPTGVENLPGALLSAGLLKELQTGQPVKEVPALNGIYSAERDRDTKCLNTQSINQFSQTLAELVRAAVSNKSFALTLGGDCSILLGVMVGLRSIGKFGLLFIDAHADFYSPETSTTGEVADMDLAIVCGRGPLELTDIGGLKPYVEEKNIIHMGQRDQEETIRYRSPDIAQTDIKRFDLPAISKAGIDLTVSAMMDHVSTMDVDGFWIHFDTDSLSDDLNPAVDYRIPGGLSFGDVELICRALTSTGKAVGMSITCFNPSLDVDGSIARNIVGSLGRMFNRRSPDSLLLAPDS